MKKNCDTTHALTGPSLSQMAKRLAHLERFERPIYALEVTASEAEGGASPQICPSRGNETEFTRIEQWWSSQSLGSLFHLAETLVKTRASKTMLEMMPAAEFVTANLGQDERSGFPFPAF